MSQELREIELDIAQADESIALLEDLMKLEKNRSFKKVILEGYFEKEAVRLVHLKADPEFQTEERQAELMKAIDAIGSLRNFFRAVYQIGRMAEKAKADHEEARNEIMAEA